MRTPALLLLTGCVEGSVLDDMDVVEATLQDATVVFAGALVGFEAGGANLEVVTADGDMLDVPVTLAGPRLGMMAGVSVGTTIVDLPLLFDDREGAGIPGSDLLGTYDGWQYSGDVLVGFRAGALVNEALVAMPVGMLELGGGASVEYAWVTLAAPAE